MEANLVMFKPDGQRKDIPVNSSTMVIGRGEDCELRVPLLSVSRRHCELTLESDKLSVKDLASSNGTYVNNERINEIGLNAGDRLVIGPVVFTIQIDGQPGDISPVKTRAQTSSDSAEISEIEPIAELVDLDGPYAQSDKSDAIASLEATDDDEQEELDPIAALEALAAESKKDQ